MRSRRDMQRWARKGTTEQRGYGHGHRQERERRILQYRPGDICAHCGRPITAWPLAVARRYIDLPHNADRTGYLPGLAHSTCNRRDGQRITTAILRARRGTPAQRGGWQSARQW